MSRSISRMFGVGKGRGRGHGFIKVDPDPPAVYGALVGIRPEAPGLVHRQSIEGSDPLHGPDGVSGPARSLVGPYVPGHCPGLVADVHDQVLALGMGGLEMKVNGGDCGRLGGPEMTMDVVDQPAVRVTEALFSPKIVSARPVPPEARR